MILYKINQEPSSDDLGTEDMGAAVEDAGSPYCKT
jgi:hypothetical protein